MIEIDVIQNQIQDLIFDIDEVQISQPINDLFSEIDDVLLLDISDNAAKYLKDEIGSFQYQIMNILEIINPDLEYDINALKSMNHLLQQWMDILNKSKT